jgi:hypothetical protein
VIDLPDGVRLESFASVDQIKTVSVGLIAPMSQHQQSCWRVSYDPVNDVIAGLALLQDLGHRAGLPVYGTDRQRWLVRVRVPGWPGLAVLRQVFVSRSVLLLRVRAYGNHSPTRRLVDRELKLRRR